MKKLFLFLICLGWLGPWSVGTASGQPAVHPELTRWFDQWAVQVNHLSGRTDSVKTGVQQQAALQAFLVADTVTMPDITEPAELYAVHPVRTTVQEWTKKLAATFWEDVFQFHLNSELQPEQVRVMGEDQQKTLLEVTISVSLQGIFRANRQPHRLSDEWVFELEATPEQQAYSHVRIRGIRRSGKPIVLPGLTNDKVVDYHDQLRQGLVSLLTDSTRRTSDLAQLRSLLPTDSVTVVRGQRADKLTLNQLASLRLPTQQVAQCRIESFDVAYCDDFFRNADGSYVGQQTALEGVSVVMNNLRWYRKQRTDVIPISHQQAQENKPLVTLSQVVVTWEAAQK